MSNSDLSQAVLYADEATFGDYSVTTFDERIPIVGTVDFTSLGQSKIPTGRTMSYTNDSERHVRGPYEASFSLTVQLPGNGTTTVGALTASQVGTLLGRVIGNVDVTQVGTTVAAAPTSASQFGLNGGTVLTNGLIRVGSHGDGRGGGQWAAVNNASTITLLTALGATPNENDVVYAAELIYPDESATSQTLTSCRMQFQSANTIYRAWGVYPTGVTISNQLGTLPTATINFGCSKAVPIGSAPTWPVAVAKNEFTGQPVGAGSLFIQNNGTVTRATKTISEFNLSIDLQVVPIRGHGTTDVYQNITSAVRTKCQASFDYVTLAEASGTNTEYDAWNTDSETFQHVLYGASTGSDGASLGFYFPYCHRVGMAPLQFSADGINRIRSRFMCGTNQTTTNALTLANFVIGLA